MKLIEGGPPALPGCCYLCGSGTRARFIDLETQVEFHGAMYLCETCIVEMAVQLGMEVEKKVTKLKFENLSMHTELSRAHEEINDLKKALNDGLADLQPYLNAESKPPDFSGDSSLSEGEESPTGEGGMERGQEGSAEPTNDEGVGELRSTESKSEYQF